MTETGTALTPNHGKAVHKFELVFTRGAVALTVIWVTGFGLYPTDVQFTPGVKSLFGQLPQYMALVFSVLVIVYSFVGLFVMRRIPFRMSLLYITLLIWAALSLTWSIAKPYSLSALFRVFVFSLLISRSVTLSVERTIETIYFTLFGMILIGVSLAVVGSPFALMNGDHSGAWRGLFPHKNIFGYVVTFWYCSFLLQSERYHAPMRVIGFAAALFVLIRIDSATGLVATILSAALYYGARILAGRGKIVIPTLIIVTVALLIALPATIDFLIGALGRDPQLTGRVDIWRYFWRAYSQAPIGGTGFGTQSFQFDIIERIRQAVKWQALGTPHNSYIYIFGELGGVGLAIFAAHTTSLVLKCTKLIAAHKQPTVAAALATIVVLAVYRFFESSLTFGPNLGMLMELTFSCAILPIVQRRRLVAALSTVR